MNARGDVLAPTATRLAMRAANGAALAAGAAPRVADPVQSVAAEPGVMLAQADSSHGDMVGHRSYHPCVPVTRLCLACGVIRECDPGLRCAECDASPFHLIPLAPPSA